MNKRLPFPTVSLYACFSRNSDTNIYLLNQRKENMKSYFKLKVRFTFKM